MSRFFIIAETPQPYILISRTSIMWAFPSNYTDPFNYPAVIWMCPVPCGPSPSLASSELYGPRLANQISIENGPQLKKEENPLNFINYEPYRSLQENSERPQLALEEENDENQRGGRRQKSGRNIISNIFRSFLRYLNSQTFRLSDFPKIRRKHGFELSEKQFTKKINAEAEGLKSYVRKKEIQEFFMTRCPSDRQFIQCLKVAIYYYVQCKHQMEIFSSKKIRRDFRVVHLSELRKFLEIFKEIKKGPK